jgi:hypothetical protein
MRRKDYLLALLLISSLALQGCSLFFSSKIEPAPGISVPHRTEIEFYAVDPLEDEPYDEDRNDFQKIALPSSIARVSDHEFVLLRRVEDELMHVEKYSDSLALAWTAPIKVDETEHTAGFFVRNGKVIVLNSRFDDENDSVHAVVNIVDLRTGNMEKPLILDTKPANTRWISKHPKKGYSAYSLEFSPDSSRILLYNKDYSGSDPDEENRVLGYNTILLDQSMNVISRGRIDYRYTDAERDDPYGLWVSNGGIVYTISNARGDTLIVNRHDLASKSEKTWRYVHDKAEVGGDESALAGGVAVRMTSDDELMLATIAQETDDHRMASILILKFNTASDAPVVVANNKLPDDLAQTMVDEKYFENYQLRDFQIAPSGNYLVFVEQTYNSVVTYSRSRTTGFGNNAHTTWETTSYPVLNAGPLAVFAYDRNGSPVWRNAFKKLQQTSPLAGLTEISYNTRFEPDGTIQLLYMDRKNDGLHWGTLSAESGKPGPFRQVMNFGNAVLFMRPYSIWLNERTMIVVGTGGIGTGELQLLTMNIPMDRQSSNAR